MKENAKLFLVSIITVIISITGSVVANTMLQANQVSYKTSNGEMADVNGALDRLFDAADINGRLGDTDISSIGDGTVTGAISGLNNFLENVNLPYIDSDYSLIKTINGIGINSVTYTVEQDCVAFGTIFQPADNASGAFTINDTPVYYIYVAGVSDVRLGVPLTFLKKGDVIKFKSKSTGALYLYAKI